MNDLLDGVGITEIDFLNMDIELGEPAALRGFDIERFQPRLVCIEMHPPVKDFLTNYFAEHNYVRIEKWSDIDRLNDYYRPASSKIEEKRTYSAAF